MPARDRQQPEGGAAAIANSTANPLREAGRAPPTGRARREVEGTEIIFDAVFLGADALALVQTNAVTLHSLTDADVDPVLLVDNSASGGMIAHGGMIASSAASADGAALCLGDSNGCRDAQIS